MTRLARTVVVLALLSGSTYLGAAPPTVPSEVLVIPAVPVVGRSSVVIDPLALSFASPEWQAPKADDKLAGRIWTPSAVKDNTLGVPGGGYAYMAVKSDTARVVVMHTIYNGMAYVNGEPRIGDLHNFRYVRLPVALRAGINDFFFSSGRGPVKVTFEEPKAAAELQYDDTFFPDLCVGVDSNALGAVIVRNCTTETVTDLVLEVTLDNNKPTLSNVPSMTPTSVRKAAFTIVGKAHQKEGRVPLKIRLLRKGDPKPLDEFLDKTIRVLDPDKQQQRTFISDIDGSVQYYSIVPAKPSPDGKKPGLVLTLHGAAVEAYRQAECYPPRPGLHIVAATNRRPWGYNWEDWGRLDGMEVLNHVSRELNTDPKRTYLTGHSMGGHGAWHFGVTFPDRFAAIAPSAGWVSMWSYAGLSKDPNAPGERELMLRTAGPSDTLALVRNLIPTGVYILHGEKDESVGVGEARIMRRELAQFHSDFVYREQPGVGHWWGDNNACVNWQPMFDFFAGHELPDKAKVKQVEFRTANPRVGADMHWLRIEAQRKAFLISKAEFTCNAEKRIFKGTTENVTRLSFDLVPFAPGQPVNVEINGQKLDDIAWPKGEARIWLVRDEDTWSVGAKPSADTKGPHRNGSFKDVFRNHVLFVYGTKGTPAENAWALAKARYDAEAFWYHANGSIDVIADTAFDPKAEPNRNVVLYGHAGMNTAWKPLLESSPVQVTQGSVKVDDRETKGDSLGALFVRPRPGSDRAMVGVVAGTGLLGLRANDRGQYLGPGGNLPDWTIFDLKGPLGTGFFGNDWKVANGESAWRKE